MTQSEAGVHQVKPCNCGAHDPTCQRGPTVQLQKVASESHDAILHGLDRNIGKLFFSKEPFEPTLSLWEGIPLVFGKNHPDPIRFAKDPGAELLRVGGVITGELSDPRIELVGHPKLIVKKNYTDETAVRMFEEGLITEEQLEASRAAISVSLELLDAGKLSHSSGFICPDNGQFLTGVVLPNHVLDFEETDLDQPKDKMAVVLNKQEDSVTQGIHLNEGKVISKKNKARLKSILDGITAFFNEMAGPIEQGVESKEPEDVQVSQEASAEVPAAQPRVAPTESLEGRIEQVRQSLNKAIGLKYPDGTDRGVYTLMTLPDLVIWEHPDTGKFFANNYTMDGGNIEFTDPMEVEQTYVVKTASMVFTNMTAEDIENITRRSKMETIEKSAHEAAIAEKDAQIAQLQKERDDYAAAVELEKKNKEDATWAELKGKVIPPGLVKEEADEAALRKLCKEDPVAFNTKILEARANTKEFGEEGSAHTSGPGAEDDSIVLTRARGRNIPGRLH
jgi:hypothetical protein